MSWFIGSLRILCAMLIMSLGILMAWEKLYGMCFLFMILIWDDRPAIVGRWWRRGVRVVQRVLERAWVPRLRLYSPRVSSRGEEKGARFQDVEAR